MVRTQSDRRVPERNAALRPGLFQKPQDGHNPLLDLVPAIEIGLEGAPDRVADVFFELIQGLVEFP